MRLTQFTDFALRALMRAAGEPDRLFTTDELARELRISRHHLVKVIRDLGAHGFVATRRGAGGGFALARAADAITLGEVVRALERRHPLVECFRSDGGGCTLTAHCRLAGRLARAQEAFMAELDRTTIEDCAWPGNDPGDLVVAAE